MVKKSDVGSKVSEMASEITAFAMDEHEDKFVHIKKDTVASVVVSIFCFFIIIVCVLGLVGLAGIDNSDFTTTQQIWFSITILSLILVSAVVFIFWTTNILVSGEGSV